MKEVKKLRFGLGFQVETDKGPVDLYSVNAEEDVSGTYVQYKDYDELLRERNELVAHVERLREESRRAEVFIESHVADPDITDEMAKAYDEYMAVRGSHRETPAQSLEAVKRELMRKTLDDVAYAVRYEFEGSFSPDAFDDFIESMP